MKILITAIILAMAAGSAMAQDCGNNGNCWRQEEYNRQLEESNQQFQDRQNESARLYEEQQQRVFELQQRQWAETAQRLAAQRQAAAMRATALPPLRPWPELHGADIPRR